jgi:murein DD-endopeptidase MepM/ murein hydrolase activator NlpD
VAASLTTGPVGNLARTAGALSRTALRALAGDFHDRVGGAAVSNLKLAMAVLMGATTVIAAVVVLPVLMIVFAISVGVSHGLDIATPAVVPPGPPLAAGELACPAPGAVTTQPFGPSELAGEPAMFGYAHFHAGVDLAITQGTPIRAAESGQVIQAAGQTDSLGFLIGYGNLVRIAASTGRMDYYGHMSAFAVSRGDVVQQNQVIGYVGSTGYSTGPHVHFEVRQNGTPVDPAPFMQRCSSA